jgi:hypothetical protein
MPLGDVGDGEMDGASSPTAAGGEGGLLSGRPRPPTLAEAFEAEGAVDAYAMALQASNALGTAGASEGGGPLPDFPGDGGVAPGGIGSVGFAPDASLDTPVPAFAPPILRVGQLWRLVRDSGLLDSATMTLATVSETLVAVRSRSTTAVLEACGRLLVLDRY